MEQGYFFAYTIFTMVIVVQPQRESEYGKDSVASDMAKIPLQRYRLEQKGLEKSRLPEHQIRAGQ